MSLHSYISFHHNNTQPEHTKPLWHVNIVQSNSETAALVEEQEVYVQNIDRFLIEK